MSDQKKLLLSYICVSAVIVLLALSNLFLGSTNISFTSVIRVLLGDVGDDVAWSTIIWQSRIPQIVTALLSGAALAISGIILQTLFHNPLADSSILGISAGANLGVALVVLSTGSVISQFSLWGNVAMILSAFIGAFCILLIILYFSARIRSTVLLLIIGIMVGYMASSAISFLNFFASANRVLSFVMWGMGDFSGVTLTQLPLFALLLILGIVLAFLLTKPLNALLLGERYAANLGVHVKRARWLILFCAGLLTAVVTAYCGPISFIGLAVPHIARLLLGTSNHRHLLPMTALLGSLMALLCNLISRMPGFPGVLPLNAITPLLGTPIIIYVILNRKNIHYFN